MLDFEMMEGSPGINLTDAIDIMVPGRGRSPDGMGLSPYSATRVVHAAKFYVHYGLAARSGLFAMSGNKTPGDTTIRQWSSEAIDETPQYFETGKPEAYAMYELLDTDPELLRIGTVPPENRRIEARSIDTVTNFTELVALQQVGFDKKRPLAIAGHEQHLERALRVARRTLHSDYVGLVVPELPDDIDVDTWLASIATKFTLATTTTHRSPERALRTTTRNAKFVWGVYRAISRLRSSTKPTYKTK